MKKNNSKETCSVRDLFKKDAFTSPSWVEFTTPINQGIGDELEKIKDQLAPGTYYLYDLIKMVRGGIVNFGLKRKYWLQFMCDKITERQYDKLMDRIDGDNSIRKKWLNCPTDIFADSNFIKVEIPLILDMHMYTLWKLETQWCIPKKLRKRIDIPETRETIAEFEFTVRHRVDNYVKRMLRNYANSLQRLSDMAGHFNLSENDTDESYIFFSSGRATVQVAIDDVMVTKGNPKDYDAYIKVVDSHYLRGRCRCSISQWTERYSGVEYKVQRTVVTNEKGEITSYTSRMPQDGSHLMSFESKKHNSKMMPSRDIEKYACHVADVYCQLDQDIKNTNQDAMRLISQLSYKQENIVNPFTATIKSSFPGVEITFPNAEFVSCASYEQIKRAPQWLVPFGSDYKMPIKISNTQLRYLFLFTKLSIYQWTWKGDDGKLCLNTYIRSVHVKNDSIVELTLQGGRYSSCNFIVDKYCYSQVLEADD